MPVDEDAPCVICNKPDSAGGMVCGDGRGQGCNRFFHIYCLTPPLLEIPDEDWYCPDCIRDMSAVAESGTVATPQAGDGSDDALDVNDGEIPTSADGDNKVPPKQEVVRNVQRNVNQTRSTPVLSNHSEIDYTDHMLIHAYYLKLVRLLRRRLQDASFGFHVDAFCDEYNKQPDCKFGWTKIMNGYQQQWGGLNVYANPPFSWLDFLRCAEKARLEFDGLHVIAILTPDWDGLSEVFAGFHTFLLSEGDREMFCVRPRTWDAGKLATAPGTDRVILGKHGFEVRIWYLGPGDPTVTSSAWHLHCLALHRGCDVLEDIVNQRIRLPQFFSKTNPVRVEDIRKINSADAYELCADCLESKAVAGGSHRSMQRREDPGGNIVDVRTAMRKLMEGNPDKHILLADYMHLHPVSTPAGYTMALVFVLVPSFWRTVRFLVNKKTTVSMIKSVLEELHQRSSGRIRPEVIILIRMCPTGGCMAR